ncbi:MAG TPA: T9SS type A sorting domain-containing protein [Bacteroidota bacterium]
MKTLALFFAQSLFITATFSQITITSTDFLKNLNVPVTTISYQSSDTLGLNALISATGENKTWNVAGKAFTATDTTTVTLLTKSTSGAPQQTYSTLSSATVVNRQRTADKPLFTFWSFFSYTTSGLFWHGYVEDSAGVAMSRQVNSPSQRLQNFPTSYLGAWSWSVSTMATTFRPSGDVSVGLNESGNDLVDASGTVSTPEGNFPCLRIKRKTNLLFGFFTLTSYSYEFVDQNRTYARIDADDVGGAPVPRSVTYFRQTSGVSTVAASVQDDFQLLQNYPNPFNPTTRIEFLLPRQEFVTLTVYNTLGQEVAVLVQGWRPAGRHSAVFDAHNLTSGIYFCHLQAGKNIDTKKLLLMK